MAGIRNAAVAQGQTATANTPVLVYTVPTSFALLLKSVLLSNSSSAAANITLYINSPSGNISPALISETNVAAGQTLVWSGWAVLNAADRVYVMSNQTPTSYWTAGAVLPYQPTLAGATVPQSESQAALTESPPPEVQFPPPPTIYLPPNQNPAYVSAV